MSFTFSESHFNRLFPFYVLINQQLVVTTTGKTLEKLYPGTKEKLFSDVFRIKRPQLPALDFKSLKSLANQLLVIECCNEKLTNLRGQIEYLPETNQLLFLGSPWFGSIEEVVENKLSLNDFAFHDSMTDLLHLMKTHEITNDDLKELLETVNRQKDELDEANKKIQDIALFPTQDPDPIIRINYSGEILQNNPAAAKLDFFEFEDQGYRNDDFFKLIASRIGEQKKGKLVFEAKSENRTYSFICITMKESNYINIYGRDITQSLEDQRQLNSLSLIIQQTHQAVVITDENVNVVWVNNSFEKVTGYTLDDVKGKTPGKLMQGVDTDPGTVTYMRRQIRKKKPFTCEIYNYKKSGEGYWIRINCQPVFDNNGKLMQYFAIEEDITLEKEAQEKIKEAANRMSTLITNLHAGILLVDGNRKIELVNNRFCELFAIPGEPTNLIGSSSLMTIEQAKIHFIDPERFVSQTNLLIAEKKLSIGHVFEMVDGRFLERDFIPIWHNNKYEGHLVVYTDITDKMNLDKKMQEQRIFYEEILDNIPADIAVFDNQHHYLYVNPKGIKDEKLRKWIIGKRDEDYAEFRNKPKSMVAGRRDLFNSIIRDKKLKSWEEELKQPDGSSHYLLRHMSPVLDKSDRVKLVIGYAVDITYTKSILLEIEESEKRYRDVIENSLALITTHDMEGTILTINPIVGKTYGYDDDELIGHSLIEFMPEDERPFFHEHYLGKIRKEKKHSGIYRVVSKSGDIIYTLYNNFLKEEPGKEPYVIGFAVDITNRVKAEEELKMAKKMTEELAQSKQNFLANMSHEIRTPMNAIMGMANQLEKTSLNKDQHYYLDIIHTATENLLVIINEILDLSKIESGKLTLEKIGFEPKIVIGKVMQVMMHKAEEKGLTFTNSFCDSRLNEVLLGDPYRLHQILLNLITNAIKFTEKGSVDISCRVITEDRLHQTVQVVVKDTGIGMSEDFVKNLFKKYSQENASTTRQFGGTGLGMSICEELIQLMGGTIEVQSQKGKGTAVIFEIQFDKGYRNQLPVKETKNVDTRILKGKRILITDDNEMNRLVAATILTNYGAILDEAKNGIEAVDKIEKGSFDIVLMDIQMPEMDGVEATQIIRSKISTSLPIIALTAFAIKGDNTKFLKSGMNDYLSKPFNESQLLQVICRWLGNTTIDLTQQTIEEQPVGLYDLKKLQEIARGNQAFVDKMLKLFMEQIPVSMAEIQTAFEAKDFEKMRAVAHRIKPSIDNMGIVSIKEDIREIEQFHIATKQSNELEGLINHVNDTLHKVIVSLGK